MVLSHGQRPTNGSYSYANAVEFSAMQAQRLGWEKYGDTQYLAHVLQYYPYGRAFTSIIFFDWEEDGEIAYVMKTCDRYETDRMDMLPYAAIKPVSELERTPN